jgi:hypothetical protein
MKMDEPYNYYASIENSKQNNVVLKYLVLWQNKMNYKFDYSKG